MTKNLLLACYRLFIDCTILKNTAIEYSENLKCVQSLLVPKASELDFVFLEVIMMGTILRDASLFTINYFK